MTDPQAWIEERLGDWIRRRIRLQGGAGARRYVRIVCASGRTAIWLQSVPENPEIVPPAFRGRDPLAAFLAATRRLADAGLPVPEILGVESEQGWMLLEDLGDRHLSDLPARLRRDREPEAIELLARAHAIPWSTADPSFDEPWIGFELQHFLAEATRGARREALEAGLRDLARAIALLPQTLCLRDFQSQNLMIDSAHRLRMIDYQDLLRAPPELDLVSFVNDSYVEREASERIGLLAHYAAHAARPADPQALAMLTVERKCKDLARFRWLARTQGDPRFEPFIGPAAKAVRSGLRDLAGPLARLAKELGPIVSEAAR